MPSRIKPGSRAQLRKKSFLEVIRPEHFPFGVYSFFQLCAHIMGDQHAHRDLKLPEEPSRTEFTAFQRCVETQKNWALPPLVQGDSAKRAWKWLCYLPKWCQFSILQMA